MSKPPRPSAVSGNAAKGAAGAPGWQRGHRPRLDGHHRPRSAGQHVQRGFRGYRNGLDRASRHPFGHHGAKTPGAPRNLGTRPLGTTAPPGAGPARPTRCPSRTTRGRCLHLDHSPTGPCRCPVPGRRGHHTRQPAGLRSPRRRCAATDIEPWSPGQHRRCADTRPGLPTAWPGNRSGLRLDSAARSFSARSQFGSRPRVD